jgi:NitT/TauT family transport system substrate-binding protein
VRTESRRPFLRTLAVGAVAAALAVGCSSSKSSGSAGTTAPGSTSGKTLRVGYSAWPGWFPLAVAEKEGLFEQAGVHVKLTYFADYTSSLDALVAKQLDLNAQTLNDTMFAVASGSPQKIVVVGDNSTGNDQVICDKSITTIAQLKGKTVAAELGVVDHFLLLQGLAKAGMTQSDINFQGVKTDAAAAAFAGGQFDCVAVFAPFTVQALKRPGSHTLFSSADFPGVIPDHYVATADLVKNDPTDVQKFVNAWYLTLAWIKAHPTEANQIMAEKAGLSESDYASLAKGTTLFDAAKAKDAFVDRPGDATSLPEMARRINPFLVSSGLTKKQAPLTGLLDPTFTDAYVAAHPSSSPAATSNTSS